MVAVCHNPYCECGPDECTVSGKAHPANLTSPKEVSGGETIVAAAVRVPVGEPWREQEWRGKRVYPDYMTITAPPPARHHTLMHPMTDHGFRIGPLDQGFITSDGRYVDRAEALRIVLSSHQPTVSPEFDLRRATELYSEDLW